MKWTKKPQINKSNLHIGCLNCSTAFLEAPLDLIIHCYGWAYVQKNGKTIYDFSNEKDSSITVREIEKEAQKDPDHDWRIVRRTPLHGETYQRHGKNKWVCIESNRGFA